MMNEFGAPLDRAGYAPSIMHRTARGRSCCYLCGKPAAGEKMDRHEPWGAANRQKSKELGLWVELHHWGCHEGPGSAHDSGEVARMLRADAQRAAMLRYGWSREEWIERFGKSELTEEECLRLIVMPKKQESDTSVACGDSSISHGETMSGAGTSRRVEQIIARLWPDHPTTTRRSSGFQLLPDADLPY